MYGTTCIRVTMVFFCEFASSNIVISEVTGRKLTKFVHDVTESSLFNRLKTASQSSNPLSNDGRRSTVYNTWRRSTCRWKIFLSPEILKKHPEVPMFSERGYGKFLQYNLGKPVYLKISSIRATVWIQH